MKIGKMRLGYLFVYFSCRSLFRLVGLKIEGMEKIPIDGPLWIVSNHQSNFDPPLMGGTIPREIYFAAKKSLFKGFLGKLITYLNSIPVNRTGFDKVAIRRLTDCVKNGKSAILFPEGTRSKDGKFLPIKNGVGLLFTLAPAPILPARIEGTFRLDKKEFFKEPVRLYFGDPIPVEELQALTGEGDRYQIITEYVFDKIRHMGNGNTDRACV